MPLDQSRQLSIVPSPEQVKAFLAKHRARIAEELAAAVPAPATRTQSEEFLR